jgi:hypothetical protein
MDIDKLAFLPVNLRMFDGGGASGAAAPAAAGAGTGAAPGAAAAEPAKAAGPDTGTKDGRREIARRALAGESVDLKPPTQKSAEGEPAKPDTAAKPEPAKGSDAGSQTQQIQIPDTSKMTPEDRKAFYQKLTREQFKDEFAADTQQIIDKRFKEAKTLQTRLDELQPLVDTLSQVHGITDVRQLTDKVKGEAVELLAEQANMDPETYADYMDAKAARERAKDAEATRVAQERQQAIVKGWFDEAAQLAGTKDKPGTIPGLDLRKESENPDFVKLLQAGVSVKAAYESVHFNDILTQRIEAAKKDTASAVAQQIQAQGARPTENGAAASSGVIVKKEVKNLTRQERAEIARRAARGEDITL